MTLDLRRMMLLRELADLGSVSAVAEHRGITSSAVSQQLRALEQDTGAVLFRRDGRTLGMTRAGEVLVEHVRKVLCALDEAESAVAAARAGILGNVTIASFNMGIPMLVVPTIARLREHQPDLHLALRQESADRAVRLLRQGEIDIAVLCRYHFDATPSLSGLFTEELMDEPMVLLAPLDRHDRIRGRGLSELADAAWVTGPTGSGLSTLLRHAAEDTGFVPRIEHRVIGAQHVCLLAATEVAAAVAPRMAVPPHLEALIVTGIRFEPRIISAVVRHGRHRDPNLRLVLRELRDTVRRHWPDTQPTGLGVAV